MLLQFDFLLHCQLLFSICLVAHQLSLLFIHGLLSIALLDFFPCQVRLYHLLHFFLLPLPCPLNCSSFLVDHCRVLMSQIESVRLRAIRWNPLALCSQIFNYGIVSR